MPSPLPQILPPLPPWLRLAILGALVAGMVYIVAAIEAAPPPEIGETLPSMETAVALPQLDEAELAKARDVTREQRLKLEPDPLRHLLARAIDVGPTVAAALGVPGKPVPVETIRAAPDEWRGRWLWYEGELEDLAGPRQGHPIEGYSIYEATIRLPDGHHAIGAFSIPPAPELQRGSWVRIEGFLLKLRDTTYPLEVERAPMLVGRRLQRDYEDWGPVTELDKDLLAKVDDSDHFPGSLMWRRVDADQTEAVWHLAAFARDTADQRTRADWRRLPLLNAIDHFEKFRGHGSRALACLLGHVADVSLLRTRRARARRRAAKCRAGTVELVAHALWGGRRRNSLGLARRCCAGGIVRVPPACDSRARGRGAHLAGRSDRRADPWAGAGGLDRAGRQLGTAPGRVLGRHSRSAGVGRRRLLVRRRGVRRAGVPCRRVRTLVLDRCARRASVARSRMECALRRGGARVGRLLVRLRCLSL
jgi:hypothetical protein